jgi:transposase
MSTRTPYPTDVTDDEWAFVAPYLSLMTPDAPQRWVAGGCVEAMVEDLRLLVRLGQGRPAQPSAAIFDSQTVQSTPESGHRAGYDGHKRLNGSKVHLAIDTLGHLLSLHVTPANTQDRSQVATLAQSVQEATGEQVNLAFVDQGYTGDASEEAAQAHGIHLDVVKLDEAKRGFVLLPRRWVAERSFAWKTRFRRLVKDYERVPDMLTGLHLVAFACLMLQQAATFLVRASP